jgi:hypothetical protein
MQKVYLPSDSPSSSILLASFFCELTVVRKRSSIQASLRDTCNIILDTAPACERAFIFWAHCLKARFSREAMRPENKFATNELCACGIPPRLKKGTIDTRKE